MHIKECVDNNMTFPSKLTYECGVLFSCWWNKVPRLHILNKKIVLSTACNHCTFYLSTQKNNCVKVTYTFRQKRSRW